MADTDDSVVPAETARPEIFNSVGDDSVTEGAEEMKYFDEDGVPQGTDDVLWFRKFQDDITEICDKLIEHGCNLTHEEMLKLAMWEVARGCIIRKDHALLDNFNVTTIALARAFKNDPLWIKQLRGAKP